MASGAVDNASAYIRGSIMDPTDGGEKNDGEGLMLVQNFTLPGYNLCKYSLDWSQDNKISVCTNQCVFILSSYCSPVETGFPLPLHKQVISAPTENLDYGLFQNLCPKTNMISYPDTLYEVLLDHTLFPQNAPDLLAFKRAKWAPQGSGENESCLLATLNMDHRLVLYREKDREWDKIVDLSEMLHSMRKESWQKEEADDPNIERVPSHESLYDEKTMGPTVSRTKKRIYDLSVVEITWTTMFGDQPSNPGENLYRWCYLITAMKSGQLVWWKVSSEDTRIVSFASEVDTNLGIITALCWQQVTPYGGFLVCGNKKGQLAFIPVVLEEDEEGDGNDSELVFKENCLIWDGDDNVMVDNIVVLKTSLKKYVIVALKQNYLLGCEVIATDNDTVIRNIGYTEAIYELPVTGISVVDVGMPQSHVIMTTTDGYVLRMKVTPQESGIEYEFNELELNLDMKHNTVQGLGVSPNGLLTAVILNTSVMYDHLIKREPLQFACFMNKSFQETFKEFGHILKPQFVFIPSASKSLCTYVDYLECMRINLASNSPIPELFSTLLSWSSESYERLSDTELYVVRFLLKCFVSGLAKTVNYEKADLEEKLSVAENIIMRNYISKVVSGCHDKIDLLTPAQGQSLLLMADWLFMEYKSPVNNLYESFGYDCPTDLESIPPREMCRICQLPVKLENMRFGECERRHKFGRCCQSLILCDVTPYYQCLSCKSVALEDVWSNQLTCIYCTFPMTK